jgi:hypothetical protein
MFQILGICGTYLRHFLRWAVRSEKHKHSVFRVFFSEGCPRHAIGSPFSIEKSREAVRVGKDDERPWIICSSQAAHACRTSGTMQSGPHMSKLLTIFEVMVNSWFCIFENFARSQERQRRSEEHPEQNSTRGHALIRLAFFRASRSMVADVDRFWKSKLTSGRSNEDPRCKGRRSFIYPFQAPSPPIGAESKGREHMSDYDNDSRTSYLVCASMSDTSEAPGKQKTCLIPPPIFNISSHGQGEM